MNAKLSAKKVIAKRDRNRVLKGLSYLAAFPLFLVFIFLGSISFMEGPAFEKTKYVGMIVGVALWLVVSLIQIIALLSKNSTARAAIVIILTGVIMVGGCVYFDIWAEKKVDEAREMYVRDAYGIDDETEVDLAAYSNLPIANYRSQINNYITWTNKSSLTDAFNADVRDFLRVYNVGYSSSVKGGVNTDGSAYGETTQVVTDEEGNETPEYWFGETGAVYKENGLYADGYIFGMDVALNILDTYYDTQAYYKEQKKNADDELDKALEKAANSTDWKNYKNSDEYKAAYGANGTADSYMLTTARLEKLVRKIGEWALNEDILGMVNSVPGVSGMIADLGITNDLFVNASLDSILTLVNGIAGTDFTAEDISELLEPFSNYQVSNVKPLMYFIDDARLRTYAYAVYFGEVHGANVGSKLIATDGGNIGCITMDSSGYNQAENAFKQDDVHLMKAKLSYIPLLYPLFAARRYAYVFAGIIAMMMAIFYYAEMKVKLIGKKLEKMSTLGGAR